MENLAVFKYCNGTETGPILSINKQMQNGIAYICFSNTSKMYLISISYPRLLISFLGFIYRVTRVIRLSIKLPFVLSGE